MRRAILIGLIALPALLSGQQQSASQKAVFALEEAWTHALVKNDTAAFRRLTVPGFIYTEDNAVMTQNELIKAVATSGDVVTQSWNEEMKFHDYTPVAVVTGILHVRGTNKGKPFHRRYRFTDTWLNRNGKWQAIAAQDYLIPQ
jgi:ketosteroid isomerase-like protein